MRKIIITESQYETLVRNEGNQVEEGPVVYLMVGIPGSGKSTWSSSMNLPIVSRDIIRAELGFCKLGDKVVVPGKEGQVTEAEQAKMAEYLRHGQSFIVDDTNLNGKFRDELIRFLKANGAKKIIGIRMNTPLKTCLDRRAGSGIPDWKMASFDKSCQEFDGSGLDDFQEWDGSGEKPVRIYPKKK